MKRTKIAAGVFATILLLLAIAARRQASEPSVVPATATPPTTPPSTAGTHEGLLYGRITTDDGAIYEGRLRSGGDEEALWGNYFKGFKDENPWVATRRPSGARSRSSESSSPAGSAKVSSAAHSWRASATSRASSLKAAIFE